MWTSLALEKNCENLKILVNRVNRNPFKILQALLRSIFTYYSILYTVHFSPLGSCYNMQVPSLFFVYFFLIQNEKYVRSFRYFYFQLIKKGVKKNLKSYFEQPNWNLTESTNNVQAGKSDVKSNRSRRRMYEREKPLIFSRCKVAGGSSSRSERQRWILWIVFFHCKLVAG